MSDKVIDELTAKVRDLASRIGTCEAPDCRYCIRDAKALLELLPDFIKPPKKGKRQ